MKKGFDCLSFFFLFKEAMSSFIQISLIFIVLLFRIFVPSLVSHLFFTKSLSLLMLFLSPNAVIWIGGIPDSCLSFLLGSYLDLHFWQDNHLVCHLQLRKVIITYEVSLGPFLDPIVGPLLCPKNCQASFPPCLIFFPSPTFSLLHNAHPLPITPL